MTKKTERCVICNQVIKGWGNNPWPLKEQGRCCNDCNSFFVIPERMRRIYLSSDRSTRQATEAEKFQR
jgi:hypothetical protein